MGLRPFFMPLITQVRRRVILRSLLPRAVHRRRALGPPCGSCQGVGITSRSSGSKAVGEVHELYSAFTPLALSLALLALSAPLLRVARIQSSATPACTAN